MWARSGHSSGPGEGFFWSPSCSWAITSLPRTQWEPRWHSSSSNALSGSLAYLRQRRVDLSLGWKFAAATIPGAVGGAYLTRVLSSQLFSLGFGVLLLAIATLLFSGTSVRPSARAQARAIVDVGGESHAYSIDVWKGVVVSFFVGLLSSVFGIGGGIIHVPFLIVALGLPVHIATATSHFVLSISTLVGAGTFLALGHVDLTLVALIGAGILAGSLALVGLRMILHIAHP